MFDFSDQMAGSTDTSTQIAYPAVVGTSAT
jgi:hypothetical protein